MEGRISYRCFTLTAMVVALVLLGGCRQEMADQPKYEPYEGASMFEDSTIMRQPVAGTISRESELEQRYQPSHHHTTYPLEPSETAGADHDGGFPIEITREVLQRGRHRFNIYCSPCHGRTGDGRGIIVLRGLRSPPSFHTERLRSAPPAHFYEVITNGYGAMYSYASRVKPADRWAITSYIRALQLSQHADPSAVPADTAIMARHEEPKELDPNPMVAEPEPMAVDSMREEDTVRE